MTEYVYLWELDSVNNSDKELVEVNERMYRVLVEEGDILVLTFNQLCDSRFFGQWILNEDMSPILVEALKNGRIKISPSGGYRSCVEYIEEAALRWSIEAYQQGKPNDDFVFSALPFMKQLSSYERFLIYQFMLKALTTGTRAVMDDLKKIDWKALTMSGGNETAPKGRTVTDADIEYLKRYVSFLLEVDVKVTEYLPVPSSAHALYSAIDDLLGQYAVQCPAQPLPAAVDDYLHNVVTEQIRKRSVILRRARDLQCDIEEKKMIERIVNLCDVCSLADGIADSLKAIGAELKRPFEGQDVVDALSTIKDYYDQYDHQYIVE